MGRDKCNARLSSYRKSSVYIQHQISVQDTHKEHTVEKKVVKTSSFNGRWDVRNYREDDVKVVDDCRNGERKVDDLDKGESIQLPNKDSVELIHDGSKIAAKTEG